MFPESRFFSRRPPPPAERITLEDLGQAEARALDAQMDHLLGPFRCPVYAAGHCDGARKTFCEACGATGHGSCEGYARRPVDLVTCCDARPRYSESFEAAGALLARMRALGWASALFWAPGEPAQASFLPRSASALDLYQLHRHPWEEEGAPDPWSTGTMTARDPSLPRAICLAVLTVLNAFIWVRHTAMSHRDWGRHPSV